MIEATWRGTGGAVLLRAGNIAPYLRDEAVWWEVDKLFDDQRG